jgi:hypothetical protein
MRRPVVVIGMMALLVAGCECGWGTPYAYRLMIPPCPSKLCQMLPHFMWDTMSRHSTFEACNHELPPSAELLNQPEALKEQLASVPRERRELLRRTLYAECVPLR